MPPTPPPLSLSSGLILRSLNLVVGQEVEEIETLVLDGFKWAWLACGLEELKALAEQMERLCIKYQRRSR